MLKAGSQSDQDASPCVGLICETQNLIIKYFSKFLMIWCKNAIQRNARIGLSLSYRRVAFLQASVRRWRNAINALCSIVLWTGLYPIAVVSKTASVASHHSQTFYKSGSVYYVIGWCVLFQSVWKICMIPATTCSVCVRNLRPCLLVSNRNVQQQHWAYTFYRNIVAWK